MLQAKSPSLAQKTTTSRLDGVKSVHYKVLTSEFASNSPKTNGSSYSDSDSEESDQRSTVNSNGNISGTNESFLLAMIPPESAYILDQKLEAHARPATPEELKFCANMTGLSEAVVDAYLRLRLARKPLVKQESIVPNETRPYRRPQRAATKIRSYVGLNNGKRSDDEDNDGADDDEAHDGNYGKARRTSRQSRVTKPAPERTWVHDDLSKVKMRTCHGPVFWQTSQCQRPVVSRFERCVACVSRNAGSCRFARTRVFGLKLDAVGKKRSDITSDDLIYGPFFQSAVEESSEGRIIDWTRQNLLKSIISVVTTTSTAVEETDPQIHYHFGSPERFILHRIISAVRYIVDRELSFAEHEPCYRREPLGLQRQLCDACLTNILSGFWMCGVCGLEICMDCYDEWDASPDASRIKRCTYSRRHGHQHMVRMRNYGLAELRWMKETIMAWQFPQLPKPPLPTDDAAFDSVAHFRRYQILNVTPLNDQLDQFQACWARGEACFVPNLLSQFTCSLWTPSWFIEHHGHEVTEMIDCRTGDALVDMTVGQFFQGFSDITVRPSDENSRCMILKLKDWPSNDDFRNKFPDHYHDFMRVLPFKPYTHLQGDLNLVNRLSNHYIWPDLGPKMYNAYGSNDGEGGAGTTNLHLDMADAVNIMLYASYLDNLPIEQQEQLIQKKMNSTNQHTAPPTASSSNGQHHRPSPEENRARYPICHDSLAFTERPPGIAAAAVWDIFPLADLPKIRDFLTHIARERNISVDDPVHDQTFYLDRGLRQRLYQEYGVKGWRIFQNPGDAVFVPAGCAHQVCNYASCIKVAMDFVSPENVSRCAQLTHEFRRLGEDHRRKQDILQLNAILYYAWQECEALLAGRKKRFSSRNIHGASKSNRSRKRQHSDTET